MKQQLLLKLIALSLSITTTSLLADTLNSDVVLCKDVKIAPKQAYSLSLTNLLPEINYTITCQMNDDNNAKNQLTFSVYAGSGNFNWFELNGTTSSYDSINQFTFKQVKNTLLMGNNVTVENQNIAITNSDNSDSIRNVTCIAVATKH